MRNIFLSDAYYKLAAAWGFKVPATSTNGLVSFGSYQVNLHAGEVRRNGFRIKLQEQPFQVLALLLERPGDVVTREELRGKLWPADAFVDFDHGLNAAVKRLRDALGDSAENPRFIETLARRGYRFIAPVTRGAVPAASLIPPMPTYIHEYLGRVEARGRWRKAAATLAVLAMGTGAGWVAARRLNPKVEIIEQRLTANPIADPVLGAVISPDNHYLAFADKAGVYLRTTQTNETHRLALPEGFRARPTSWFPDGTHVLVTSSLAPIEKLDNAGDKPSLWEASIFGGAPYKLVDGAESGVVSTDGTQILFLRNPTFSVMDHSVPTTDETGFPQIWLVQSDGENPRKLLGAPHHFYSSFAWSPSGDRFAFLDEIFRPSYTGGEVSICIYHLEDGHTDSVRTSPRLASGLAWTLDGRLIYSEGEPPPNQGDSNLWAQSLDTATDKPIGHPIRLTNGPDAKTNVSVSADGKHLVFLRRTGNTEIFAAEADTANGRLVSVEPLHLEQHRQFPYAWTPDSKSVLFASDRDGPFHLFKQAVDQLTPDLVFGEENSVSVMRPAPDGSKVLFLIPPKPDDSSGLTRLMQISLAGGSPRFILADRDIHNFQCARAPSSVCIYSGYAEDRALFFTFDLATGQKVPIIEIPGPEWRNWTLSPDGSTLALANWRHVENNPTIELQPIKGGPQSVVSVGHNLRICSIDFAADGHSIWTVVQNAAGGRTLLNVDLRGRVKPMFEENQKVLGWAIPAPDGRHLAFWEASGTSNAWLLQGF